MRLVRVVIVGSSWVSLDWGIDSLLLERRHVGVGLHLSSWWHSIVIARVSLLRRHVEVLRGSIHKLRRLEAGSIRNIARGCLKASLHGLCVGVVHLLLMLLNQRLHHIVVLKGSFQLQVLLAALHTAEDHADDRDQEENGDEDNPEDLGTLLHRAALAIDPASAVAIVVARVVVAV